MASLGSYTQSAAQATSSAYRRLPIRWRLAGGSAALTLVILCGFAVIVGELTTRRLESNFNQELVATAEKLKKQIHWRVIRLGDGRYQVRYDVGRSPDLTDYAAGDGAAIRLLTVQGGEFARSQGAPPLGRPAEELVDVDGWRVASRRVENLPVYVQYARRISELQAEAATVRLFLGLGVLGGALLALLAGLATARRAMSPIAQLTDAARAIARTRDPSLKIPHPEAEDEVAELARTLEDMLHSLDQARGETESALARQREFVADASHELRTPLTSVLANLELLEESLEGEEHEAAASALRSSRRMRRLVADLLLLARADAGRARPHEPLDLAEVVAEAAGELEPVAGDDQITVAAVPGAVVSGTRDELHRLVLNLLENGLRHTDPGTAVVASVERVHGQVVLAVEDDGPGVPPELREKVFERFFRGSSDRGGSSGLGLAIVRAVAESHGGAVALEEPLDGRGARFVVRLPALAAPESPAAIPMDDARAAELPLAGSRLFTRGIEPGAS